MLQLCNVEEEKEKNREEEFWKKPLGAWI
ncbi:unnamed protein product, partial [Acanthocheilonema viteae]